MKKTLRITAAAIAAFSAGLYAWQASWGPPAPGPDGWSVIPAGVTLTMGGDQPHGFYASIRNTGSSPIEVSTSEDRGGSTRRLAPGDVRGVRVSPGDALFVANLSDAQIAELRLVYYSDTYMTIAMAKGPLYRTGGLMRR